MIKNEVSKNKIGKAFVRQSEKERTRLLLAKMINDKNER